jgi:hypothetical protein
MVSQLCARLNDPSTCSSHRADAAGRSQLLMPPGAAFSLMIDFGCDWLVARACRDDFRSSLLLMSDLACRLLLVKVGGAEAGPRSPRVWAC